MINNVNNKQQINSTSSLVTSSSLSSINRSPFYNINNNGLTNSVASHLTPQNNAQSNVNFTTKSAEFSKYNHLAQYQQQQNLLSGNSPFNFNSSSDVISPNNSQLNNSLNNSFNNSLAFFRNGQANIPLSSTLNSMQYRISAPTTPAPLPPTSFNNPSYFQPQNSAVGTDEENQSRNHMNEQDLLDDGFLNLFQNKSASNSQNNQHPNIPIIPHRYNQSNFNTSSKFNNHSNNNTGHARQAHNKISKKKKKSSMNLIDLNTTIEDLVKSDNIVDLFDPLAQMKLQEDTKNNQNLNEDSDEIDESEEENDRENIKTDDKFDETDSYESETKDSQGKLSKIALRRHPLPRNEKPNTNGHENYLTRIEDFRVIDLNTNKEIESFNKSINQLSKEIKINTKKLDNLIVFSPILDCPLNQRKNIKLIVRYSSDLNHTNRFLQEVITPSLNATVETVVYHVLSLFGIDDLDTDKYLLKIHGCEEYLPINANLSDLKYLHECLTINRDPILNLMEIESIKIELSTDDKENTTEKPFKFSNKFEKNKLIISKAKLEKVLQGIVQDRKHIEETVDEAENNKSQLSQLSSLINWCANLKEKLRNLTNTVCKIHYACVEQIIDRLEFNEKNLRNYESGYFMKDKQPLMLTTNETEDDYCIIDRGFGRNSSGFTDDNLQLLFANLVEIANDSMHCILLFVNCASDSLSFPFKLKPIYKKSRSESINSIKTEDSDNQSRCGSVYEQEKIEIIQSDEKFFLYFKGISRLNNFLIEKASSSINDLYIRFSIYHGTQLLDSYAVKLDKYEKLLQKKIEFFTTDNKILFRNTDLCLLPKEAILVIQLCTYNPSSSSNSQGYSNLNSDENSSYKCLAWSSKSLFDDNLLLRHGDYLMNFFSNDMPQICTSASNIYSNKCPIVQICIMAQAKTKILPLDEETLYTYPNYTQEVECNMKDFQKLEPEIKENLLQICNKSVIAKNISEDDRDLLHKYYLYLNGIPNALSKIYLSFSSWDYSSMIHFVAYIKQCDLITLSESLEILLPNFTENELRNHAVRSLQTYSEETLSLYLPQFLEALKFEWKHNSELLLMLLTLAFRNIRFAHKLYWQVKEFKSRSDDYMYIRYELLHQALIYLLSKPMIDELTQENFLVDNIDRIGTEVKKNKDNVVLLNELEAFSNQWSVKTKNDASVRLPYNISYCTREIEIKSCSVISSFTMPLKLVFRNVDNTANSFYTIYKIGDDLRQDMFVLQLINVMNQLWIMEDHDLSVLTFTCLQTSERRGFIEMITNAETLKEIQKGEVMKAFKQGCINDWLKSHNPNPNNFKKAVRNFTKSCAAYSVATYLLGIGDRHNDNIMVKYTGHMFHIDFGKYLGDAQTFAGIKRDRTPMLFTSDMFYVINQGKQANALFQEFVEMCCKAFQILRKNYHLLLTLIELMTNSGIPGLNKNAIQFVYKNLMIDLDEDRASNAFKKLIHESLSKFASFNFAIHTLAQPKTVNSTNYFSFVTHTFNSETDGKIINIALDDMNSGVNFKCIVSRETEYDTNEVYRSFEEFCELYQLLIKTFPTLRLPETPPFNRFKEIKQLIKRRQCIYLLLKDLMSLQSEISQSDIVYTFFHSILRDQKEDFIYLSEKTNYDDLDVAASERIMSENETYFQDIKGQIKVKLRFKDNKFFVNCLQCRNLRSSNQSASSLKPYVKCYLRPDSTKATKKKTQALFNGANPIFTETMEYDISLIDFKNRTLEISVLNNNISKDKIGSVEIRLYDLDFKQGEYIKWYELR